MMSTSVARTTGGAARNVPTPWAHILAAADQVSIFWKIEKLVMTVTSATIETVAVPMVASTLLEAFIATAQSVSNYWMGTSAKTLMNVSLKKYAPTNVSTLPAVTSAFALISTISQTRDANPQTRAT